MHTQSTPAQHLQRKKIPRLSTPPGTPHTRRSSSLTPPGFLFVFVTLFLALGAINGQNNLLFWLFGFSIAALIVSGIITGTALIAIRLHAHPLQSTELGSPLKPRYTLHNTSKLLPNFALQIIELPSQKNTPLQNSTPAITLHLPPNTHTIAQSQIIPTTRGLLNLQTIRIRTRFPFGLFTKTIDFTLPRQALILPTPLQINQTTIEKLTNSDDTSTRSLNRRGAGLDYFALREYQPGDALRTIAWKQSARTDTLLVTEYPEPATDQLTLELSTPTSQTPEAQFERAISLTYSLLKAAPLHTRIALTIPFASINIPPATGQAHIDRCARTLALLTRPTHPQPHHHPSQKQSRHHQLTIGYTRSTDQTPSDLYAEDFTPPISSTTTPS